VSFVKQEHNINEMESFKEFWDKMGVDYVVLRMMHSAGGFFPGADDEAIDKYPCVFPWERIKLTPQGDLCFCGFSWLDKRTIHEDYNATTIREIWIGDDYSALRNEHLSNSFNKFPICDNCSDKHLTIWPANKANGHRGYGDMIKDFTEK